jgi:hypothetical protein
MNLQNIRTCKSNHKDSGLRMHVLRDLHILHHRFILHQNNFHKLYNNVTLIFSAISEVNMLNYAYPQ